MESNPCSSVSTFSFFLRRNPCCCNQFPAMANHQAQSPNLQAFNQSTAQKPWLSAITPSPARNQSTTIPAHHHHHSKLQAHLNSSCSCTSNSTNHRAMSLFITTVTNSNSNTGLTVSNHHPRTPMFFLTNCTVRSHLRPPNHEPGIAANRTSPPPCPCCSRRQSLSHQRCRHPRPHRATTVLLRRRRSLHTAAVFIPAHGPIHRCHRSSQAPSSFSTDLPLHAQPSYCRRLLRCFRRLEPSPAANHVFSVPLLAGLVQFSASPSTSPDRSPCSHAAAKPAASLKAPSLCFDKERRRKRLEGSKEIRAEGNRKKNKKMALKSQTGSRKEKRKENSTFVWFGLLTKSGPRPSSILLSAPAKSKTVLKLSSPPAPEEQCSVSEHIAEPSTCA